MIDFLYTGNHHFLRDLATLEADLVLRVLSPMDASVAQAREFVTLLEPYYTMAAFTTPAEHEFLGTGQRLPLQNAVRELRSAVWGRAKHDALQIPGYLIAVIRRMLKMAVRPDSQLTPFQRWLAARIVVIQAKLLAQGDRSARLPHPVSGERVRERVPDSPADQPAAYLDLESRAEVIIGQMSKQWRPTPVGPVEAQLPAIAAELQRKLPPRHRHLGQVFDRLAASHPEPITGAADAVGASGVDEVNRVLARLTSNQLIEVRVRRGGDDARTTLWISSPDIASRLSHMPPDPTTLHPMLRAAWSLYDTGAYSASLERFMAVATDLGHGRTPITRSELALFFYYLSKCLLKLNMYSALHKCIDGPYRAFSTAMCPELETERLLIAGVAYRHQGELVSAQACLDDAVSQLVVLSEKSASPSVWLSLADAYVLSVHPRLDQAAAGIGMLAQQASVRFAIGAVKHAEETYQKYWNANGPTSHYEGRLSGTMAYITVIRSIVDPGGLDVEAWASAEARAREGFGPMYERKAVGNIAGHAALATVKLAEARWHCVTRGKGWSERSQKCLGDARKALGVILDQDLSHVELGPRFEYRKLVAIRVAAAELAANPAAQIHPDALTPLI